MYKLSFLLSFLLVASLTFAQNEIVHEPHNPGWEVDMQKAFKMSQETGKPIMANFTGSDWCGWCIRLTKSVFSKPAFKAWAAENVILLELDFPRRSKLPAALAKQNNELQRAFKVSGFPTVWVFNAEKDPETNGLSIQALGKTGYAKTVNDFTGAVDQMIAKAAK